MAWTYEQQFDSLTTAALNGQDSWTGDIDYLVQSSVTFFGTKALSQTAANGTISRTITSVSSGIMYVAMRANATAISGAMDSTFQLSDGVNPRCVFGFHSNTFKYGSSGALTTLFTPTADQWYLIECEIIASTGQYKLRYHDGVSWSAQTAALAGYVGTGDIVRIDINSGAVASATTYFDCISPYATGFAPSVTTNAVSSIGLTTATGNGDVTSDNGYIITERGIVWSLTSSPTTSNFKTIVSGTTGAFTGSMTGLSVNTLYYVRAYAVSSQGFSYGNEVTFTTANITSTDLNKNISATTGDVYAVRATLTGTLGTVTVKLGTTGTSAIFTATGGTQTMQGTYSGTDGIIFTRSGTFNGTLDNVQWVKVLGTGTINWSLANYITVFAINSSVKFKKIEDTIFNEFMFYRYLDLLFKDYDGYVTVTIDQELNNVVTAKSKVVLVGNTTTPASAFSKRRISFLCKNQAITITLSNANLNETFSIAQFLLEGDKRPRKMYSASKINSV